MTLIDDRGRVFGRVNLLDAVIACVLVALVPLAFGLFVLFRPAPVEIVAVEPATLARGTTQRLQISGRNLRPNLFAWVGDVPAAGLLIESPTIAEIKLPQGLAPGTYDVSLRDAEREIARRKGAFTIVDPTVETAPKTDGPTWADVAVRFVLPREVLPLIQTGAEDLSKNDPAVAIANVTAGPGATIASFRKTRDVTGRVSVPVGSASWIAMEHGMVEVEAVLRMPLESVANGWRYGTKSVKLGASWQFETKVYSLQGWIVGIKVAPPDERGRQGGT